MIATLNTEDWSAISALGVWAGAIATFAAIVVALFGEQIRRWYMRPRLSISCGVDGLLFQQLHHFEVGPDFFHIRLLVSNYGKESAQNVQCVLASIRTWKGETWTPVDNHFPTRMIWTTEKADTLNILVPDSSSFLKLGNFEGQNFPFIELLPGIIKSMDRISPGRYEIELILTSEHHLHYHGFFEFSWEQPSSGKASETFAIKESRRIKSE